MAHILHLTRDFPPRWMGGISTAVASIVDQQRRDGHTVTVCSFDSWRPTKGPADANTAPLDVDQHIVATPTHGALRVIRCVSGVSLDRVRATLAGTAFDILEVHHATLWLLLDALDVRRIPNLIYTAHVYAAEMDRMRGLDRQTLSAQSEAAALREAHAVMATSAAMGEALRAAFPECASKLNVRRHQLRVDTLPAHVPYAQRRTDIAVFGRFSDVKNSDAAVDIVRRALSAHSTYRAVVVGGLPDNQRTERRLWTRFLDSCTPEVAERIHFHGWLPRPEALAQMAQSRVVLAASHIETWGLVVHEAMALGCCVVATPIPAHDEQIVHGETGYLSPDMSDDALYATLMSALDDPSAQKRISDAARAAKHKTSSDG